VPDAARAAKNESLFREVNEQIHKLERHFGGNPSARFVCECSRRDCTARLEATLDEYTAVRESPTQFMVVRSHVDIDNERVVRSTDRFTVVEKLGVAGDVAEAAAD
jgi:hypothetical protein